MYCSSSTIDITILTDLPCSSALSLKPDDVEIPPGLSIMHDCVDGMYRARLMIRTEFVKNILTLKNTVDELLRLIRLIANVEKF